MIYGPEGSNGKLSNILWFPKLGLSELILIWNGIEKEGISFLRDFERIPQKLALG